MGQKINPYGYRLGVTTDWKSRWFSERDYKEYLTEDWTIRQQIMERLESAAISRIEIERTRDKLRVDVHTARPGIVIGRRGAQADELRQLITKIGIVLDSGFKDGALISFRPIDFFEFVEPEQATQFFSIDFIVLLATFIDQGVFPRVTNEDPS